MTERQQNQRNDITRSFQRVFNFPLDRSTIFDTYQDAENYAKGDGSDSRKLGKTVYPGQVISVVNTDESTVKVYKVTFGTSGLVPPYALEQIAEGSELGGGTTEEAFSFKTKNGNIIVPAGSNLTEVVSLLRQISDLKSDGVTTAPIKNKDNELIVTSGTDITTAINAIVTYMEENGGAGNISEDIEYDGETIVESGATLVEALQAVVNKIFTNAGISSMTVNGEPVYDPSTNVAAFNIEGADSDINIEFDGDAAVPTFYVELSGISNGTVILEGEEVRFAVKIYDYSDGTTLLDTVEDSTFMTGGTKSKTVSLGDTTQYNFYDQNRNLMTPDANGLFSFNVTTSTTEFVVFRDAINENPCSCDGTDSLCLCDGCDAADSDPCSCDGTDLCMQNCTAFN